MIGRFIQQQRIRLNLTQKYLASKLGVSRSTVKRIEYGKRELTLTEAKKLALIFGISLENLLEKKEPELVVNAGQAPVGRSVEIQIRITPKNLEKFRQVLLYILNEAGAKPGVNEKVLHKLLYFIDFGYYRGYAENLMGLTYIKDYTGPVPLEFSTVAGEMQEKGEIEVVQSVYFKYPRKKYLPLKKPDLALLSAREIKYIDHILACYSDKDASWLERRCRQEAPWVSAKYGKPLSYDISGGRPL